MVEIQALSFLSSLEFFPGSEITTLSFLFPGTKGREICFSASYLHLPLQLHFSSAHTRPPRRLSHIPKSTLKLTKVSRRDEYVKSETKAGKYYSQSDRLFVIYLKFFLSKRVSVPRKKNISMLRASRDNYVLDWVGLFFFVDWGVAQPLHYRVLVRNAWAIALWLSKR